MRSNPTNRAHGTGRRPVRRDAGVSGIGLLTVVAVAGLLGSGAAVVLTGSATEAAAPALAARTCQTEATALSAAAIGFMSAGELTAIPAASTGDEHDRVEQTLVEHGYLRTPSPSYDLTSSGAIVTAEGSSC